MSELKITNITILSIGTAVVEVHQYYNCLFRAFTYTNLNIERKLFFVTDLYVSATEVVNKSFEMLKLSHVKY